MSYETTYYAHVNVCAVGLANKRKIEVEEVSLPLEGELVEGAQAIERDYSLRSCRGCRKPLLAKELCSFVKDIILTTITVVNIDPMCPRYIEYKEPFGPCTWSRTRQSIMTKLYMQT